MRVNGKEIENIDLVFGTFLLTIVLLLLVATPLFIYHNEKEHDKSRAAEEAALHQKAESFCGNSNNLVTFFHYTQGPKDIDGAVCLNKDHEPTIVVKK